jgi:hypothetical protein
MKKQIEIGQIHEVELLPNGSPKKQPICRVDGMIGFIHHDNREIVKAGEKWHVVVAEVKEKYCIVIPVFIAATEKEVEDEKNALIATLRHEKTKKEKKTRKYQFCSFEELKRLKMA